MLPTVRLCPTCGEVLSGRETHGPAECAERLARFDRMEFDPWATTAGAPTPIYDRDEKRK